VAESMGGQLIIPGQSAQGDLILYTVQELSEKANLKAVPTCYWIPTQEMNAFAAGLTHRDSIVAVTQGISNTLSKEELHAVIAHEIGHLVNQDSRTATHLIAINSGFFALFRLGLNMLGRGQNNSNSKNNPNAVAFVLMLAGGASSLLGLLFRQAVTRSREYSADACSLAFTGEHKHLASALRKISRQSTSQQQGVLQLPGNKLMFSHMYLNNPRANSFIKMPNFIMKAISTHPPIEDRIARLEQLNQKVLAGPFKNRLKDK